jgi:antitoxin (DNA-binding transcriptional repressor) of toxin-antitoxin stability system
MTRTTISQAELATHTQEVVDRVQHGEIAFVEKSGQEQAVLLDPLDFRLLQALARCAVVETEHEQPQGDSDSAALQAYLADEISLGKAADLLGISRFELQDRFLRLDVPLRLGPASLDEARAEVSVALKLD